MEKMIDLLESNTLDCKMKEFEKNSKTVMNQLIKSLEEYNDILKQFQK